MAYQNVTPRLGSEKVKYLLTSVVDPEFPSGANPLFCRKFPENCIKMIEFAPLDPPLNTGGPHPIGDLITRQIY